MIIGSEKQIFIIAGPNGAGKTTFAREFLPQEAQCLNFINADLIAAGLHPFQPEKAAIAAGRLMLQQIDHHLDNDASFAFETTLSGRLYLKRIPQWQDMGYTVRLFFLRLSSPEQAIDRVERRVQEGGHNVPESTIRRRFTAGWNNFQDQYRFVVNHWTLFDTSGETIRFIDQGGKS